MGIKNIALKVQGTDDLNIDNLPLASDSVGSFKVYASASPENLDLDGKTEISFVAIDNKTGQQVTKNSVFISK
jgi:hypothetical protein